MEEDYVPTKFYILEMKDSVGIFVETFCIFTGETMTEVTVHEAKSHLSQLIQQVINGEEVVISSRNKPKIKLILAEPAATPRKVGLGKGSVLFMAEDFNETPEEFREDTA